MKRLTSLLAVVAVLSSLTGCCCLCPSYGNACNPCNPCGPGIFPGGGPVYTPQGAYQSYDAVTGLPLPTTTAYQPVAGTAVALGPLEALPTYR